MRAVCYVIGICYLADGNIACGFIWIGIGLVMKLVSEGLFWILDKIDDLDRKRNVMYSPRPSESRNRASNPYHKYRKDCGYDWVDDPIDGECIVENDGTMRNEYGMVVGRINRTGSCSGFDEDGHYYQIHNKYFNSDD